MHRPRIAAARKRKGSSPSTPGYRPTPTEGESLFNIVSGHVPIMETAEFDRRLAELETNTENVKPYRAELQQFLQNGGLGKIVKDGKEGLL